MSRPTNVIAFPARAVPRCGDCAGWDGGSDETGDCLFLGGEVGRRASACPDFFRMPTLDELRSLR